MAQVRALCSLVESPPATPTSDARDLEGRLLVLHLAALDLPDVEPDTDNSEPPLDLTLINKARLAALPVALYWDVFDPLRTPPDAPVANWSAPFTSPAAMERALSNKALHPT